MTAAQSQSRNGRNLFTLFSMTLLAGLLSSAGSQNSNCDPNVLVVDLNDADLNEIKKRVTLGTLKSNTFLSIDDTTIKDMANLKVETINGANALKADTVLTDNVGATLKEWVLNMNEAKLYLTFTETVKASAFTPNTVKILKGAAANSAGVTIDSAGTKSTVDSTIITLVLSDAVSNTIKADVALGTTAGDNGDTFLHYTTSTITDMANNELSAAAPKSAKTVVDDTTKPVLSRFELDMDANEIKLIFEETVKATSIDVRELAISGLSDGSNPIALTGATRVAGTDDISTSVTLELTKEKLNELKIDTNVAVAGKSYIVLGADAITDMADATNAAVVRAADAFQADETDPELDSFSINMKTGTITLVFNEAIDATTLTSNSVKILKGKSSPVNHPFSNDGTTQSTDGTTYIMKIATADFNALTKAEDLATSQADTFLSISAGGVKDMTGRSSKVIADADALQATAYVDDTQKPTLDTYTLDMNAGELILTFSETMNAAAASIVVYDAVNSVSNIQIQSTQKASDTGSKVIALSGSTDVTQADSAVVTIKLLAADLEKLKLDDTIATDKNSGNSVFDTYLSYKSGLIKDQSDQALTERSDEAALVRTAYTADQTKPILLTSAFDLDAGKLTLNFDESVRHSEVKPKDGASNTLISLADKATNPTVTVGIPSASVEATNGKAIVLTLAVAELNAVKKAKALCISSDSCVVVLSANAAGDMAQTPNKNLATSKSSSWSEDKTAPKITDFQYSMGGFGGEITLVVDETVDASSTNEKTITLQNKRDATLEHTIDAITNKGTLVDGTSFSMTLSAADVAALKTKGICTGKSTCFIRIEQGVFTDMSTDEHPTDEITDSLAMQATSHVPDETDPPVLEFSDLNYNTGTIHLKFKEPVDWNTLDPKQLTLRETASANKQQEANKVTLTGGTVPETVTTDLVLTMNAVDLNKLKSITATCKNDNGVGCVMELEPSFISDIAGNPMTTNEFGTGEAAKVTLDVTGPVLKKADINIEANTLKLSFDEAVATATLSLASLKFIDAADPSGKSTELALEASNLNLNSKVEEFEFTIPAAELEKVKADGDLCTEVADCFVLLSANFVQDISAAGTFNTDMDSAIRVTGFQKDSTKPTVSEFTSYNPNNGAFVVEFNEPINKESVSWTKITFQSKADNSGNDAVTYTLTEAGTSEYVDATTKRSVEFVMTATDVEAIQLKTTTLLSTTSNSFILVGQDVIADMVGETLDAITTGLDAKSIAARDAAKLASFTLNMATKKLELTFDRSMKSNSFDPTQITLMSAAGTGSTIKTVPLTSSSTTSSSDGTKILIDLGDDIAAITETRGLATKGPDGANDVGDTFLALTATAFTDIFGDNVEAVVPAKAQSVARPGYTVDNIAPELTSFEFKLDPGSITMVFTEVMDMTTFDSSKLKLTSTSNAGPAIDLTGGTPDEDDAAATFTVQLSDTALNAIKANDNVGLTKDNTDLIMTSDAIDDMAGVQVTKIDSPGKAAAKVSGDLSGPKLNSFTMNMNDGTMLLTFSETTVASSVVPTKLTLQTSVENPTDSLTFQSGSKATTVSATIIKFTMIDDDVNKIKAKRGLAAAEGSTVLVASAGAFKDSASNDLEAKTLAVATNGYTPDTTAPELDKAYLDLEAKQLTLSFTETVAGTGNPTAVTITSITLVGLSVGNTAAPTFALTSASTLNDAVDAVTLVFDLGDDDLNIIKNTANLCTKREDSFVAVADSFISDTGTKKIVAIATATPLQVLTYEEDTGAPTLSSFALDMNAKKLKINFNEPVDSSTFEPKNVVLQATTDVSASGEFYRLTGGDKAASADGLAVTVTLTQDDVNAINAKTTLAKDKESTFISFPVTLVEDKSIPAVSMATSTNAQGVKAGAYTNDQDAPALVKFDLNMNAGELVLYFDETMKTAVVVGGFTLQSVASASASQQRTLTSGSQVTTATPGVEITIKLSDADMTFMTLNGIGITAGTSYLTMGTDSAVDMKNLAAPAKVNGVSALEVDTDGYTPDTTSPTLDKFDFSVDSGELTLEFSESVKASNFKPNAFTLQNVDSVNKVCPCQKCLANEVNLGACSQAPMRDTQCKACEECPIGQYEVSECTPTDNNQNAGTDSVCADCKTCQSDEYLKTWCANNVQAVCVSCSADCTQCTGEGNTCLACNNGKFLSNGACVAACPNTEFADNNGVCQLCDSSCSTCDGPAATDCTACKPNFVKSSDQDWLDKCTDANCYQKGTKLQASDDRGSAINGVGCDLCDATCATCFGTAANECITCMPATPFLKGRDTCVASCGTGYFADSNDVCQACSPDCEDCSSATQCDQCASNKILEDGKCFQMTPTSAKQQLEALPTSPQVSYPVGTSTRGDLTCTQEAAVEYTMTTDTATASSDDLKIVVKLSDADLNEVKALTSLGTSASNTFLAATELGITDISSVKLKARSPTPVCPDPCYGTCACPIGNLKVEDFERDGTDIELADFSLNMDGAGEILLTFSETFNLDDLTVNKLTLQDKADCSTVAKGCATAITLDNGGAKSRVSNTVAKIVPVKTDMEKIKASRTLGTATSNTFAVFTLALATDMRGLSITPVDTDAAKVATAFSADQTSPTLLSYDLNLHTEKLTLHFDETIDRAEVKPKSLTLHSDSAGANAYTLTGGIVSASDSEAIEITLAYDDLNKIKTTAIGVNKGSTYLSMTNVAAKDTAVPANKITAISAGSPKQVSNNYTPDTKAPELSSFKLDMHAGSMVFTFNEAVKASTFDATKFVLQSTATAADVSVTLAAKTDPTTNDDEITIELTDAVMNKIKLSNSLGGAFGESFLTMTAEGVQDMNAQPVKAIVSGDALDLKANMYTADGKDPELLKFEFNMNTLEIKMFFNEPVAATSFDATKITVQHAATGESAKRVTFAADTGSAMKSDAANNGLELTAKIDVTSANAIKSITALATSDQNTFIIFTAAAVKDLARTPNSVKAINDGTAKQVEPNKYTADGTRPELESFTLNMHTLTLAMTFNEVINPDNTKVDLTGFGLQASGNANTEVALTDGTITTASPGTVLTITLDDADANKVKAATSIASEESNTYLTIAAGAVVDITNNDVVEVSTTDAKKVATGGFTADTKAPTLKSVEVTMPTGEPPMHLILEFDESIKVVDSNGNSAVDATGITLQNVQDGTPQDTKSHTLVKPGTVGAVSGSTTKIDVTVDNADLVSIKALAGVGREVSNTFVALATKTITDMANVAVAERPVNNAKQISANTADITPPTLSSFTIDFGLNALALTFSEDVVLSTFDETKVIVQRSATTGNTADKTLSTAISVTAGTNGKIVIIKMVKADIDFLKADSGLAVSEDTTYLNLPADIVQDAAKNDVGAVTIQKAAGYVKDNVGPKLQSYNLNMETGTLTMVFDEVVKRTSVTASALKIQSTETDNTVVSDALDGAAQGSTDSTTVTVVLTLASANKLRAVKTLAVDKASTWLTLDTSFATDVDSNDATAVVTTAAKNVGTHTPDGEVPTASGFAINLKAGSMVITFNKPVDGSSVDVEQLTLVNDKANPDAANSHKLTGKTSSSTAVSTEVTIVFTEDDLNSIKERALCDNVNKNSKCFIAFTNTFIKDATDAALAAVATSDAVQAVDPYVADDEAPELVRFSEYDQNTGKITLSFSEVVDPDTFTPSKFTLVADSDESDDPATYELTGGTVDDGSDNTALVITLSETDHEKIRLKGWTAGSVTQGSKSLCGSRQMCYIKLAAGGFKDFASNSLAETPSNDNERTRKHKRSTTKPTLASWTLNMQASTATLQFSDPVNVMRFDRSEVTLLKDKGSSTKLALEACPAGQQCSTQTHGSSISVDISPADLNKIKLAQFATSASDSYLSITEDAVKDLSALELTAIADSDAVAVKTDGYDEDIGKPSFTGFTFTLDDGKIKFTFDEPVKPDTFNVNGIVLQGSKTSQVKKVTLTTGSAEETDALVMEVTYAVAGQNLVDLIATSGLFTGETDSFVSIPAGAIKDSKALSSNVVAGSDALQITADGYTGDTTPGKLVQFDVDFALRQLQFTFDEVVKVSTFVAADVTIQSKQHRCPVVNGAKVCDENADSYELTTSTVVGSTNSKIVKIQLSDADYIALGEKTGLLVDASNSFIVTTAGAFSDTYGRDITASTDGTNAVKLTNIIEDNTKPSVTKSIVNLQDETITLTVSEAIFKGTVDTKQITLQEAAGTCAVATCYTLTSTEYEMNDAQTEIEITLNDADLNAIKANDKLVLTTATTSFSHTDSIFSDFRSNAPTAVAEGAAVAVNTLTPDETKPTLDSYTINMDDGELKLTFSEVVRANTVTMTAYTIQGAATATAGASHTLGTGGERSTTNGLTITITMSVSDLNAIKAKSMATKTDGTDTYLVVTAAGAKDMLLATGNSLAKIDDGSALKATSLVKDKTNPDLSSFELSMNTGLLTMLFSETVVAKNFDPTQLTFHQLADGSGQKYTLKEGTPSTTDSTTVTLQLAKDDLNAIKSDAALVVDEGSTHLAMTVDAVRDVSNNKVNAEAPTAPMAHKVGAFTADGTKAELESFTMDMDGAGKLSLTFKESINPAKLKVDQITLQSTAVGGSSVTLSGKANPSTTTGVTVEFNLVEADMIKLKLDTDLCTTAGNTFIAITGTVIEDMIGNGAKAIAGDGTTAAMQVSTATDGYKPDGTSPTLTSFALNMNTAALTLLVSEPVADAVDLTQITLASANGQKDFTLTSDSAYALSNNKMQIDVTIGSADLNQMKAETTLAISDASSVLVFAKELMSDRASSANDVTPKVFSDAETPSAFQVDDKPPTLVNFDFTVATGVLKLYWSETVNKDKLSKTKFTFVKAQGHSQQGAGSHELADDGEVVVDNTDPSVLIFTVSAADLNAITADTTLCVSKTTCLLTIETGAVADMLDRPSTAIASAAAKTPASFPDDQDKPELKSFVLNMNENKLYLTFSETMKVADFDETTLKIMVAAAPNSDGVPITTAKSKSTADSTIVEVELNAANANAIKANTNLATDTNGGATGDTFLLFTAGTAVDMSNNELEVLSPAGTGLPAASVVADSTAPKLFSGNLNMNAGTLTLVFDEAVNINTLQQNKISLQGVADTQASSDKVPLTTTTSWAATNSITIVITLSADDLNALKKHESVATNAGTTFLTIAAGAIQDMASLNIAAVPDSAAFDVTGYTVDGKKPTLDEFEIDLSAGTIKLKFSETVDVSTLKANQFTIQNCAD
jgi:hypothetical protein